MGLKIFLGGKFVDEKQAKISVFDHCLLYGDGVFEGIRLYRGCIFRLREHIERLYSSAKYIMLRIPMSKSALVEKVRETVRRNGLKDGYIRLVVTRGIGTLGLAPWKCKNPTVFIIADRITLYPEEFYKKGLEIVTVPTRRSHVESLNPRVKSCNYLNNILAKIEAWNAGALEALMLDQNGFVNECTGDNIFLVKNGELITPPVYLGTLGGITRGVVIELAAKEGITVREEPFTRFDVFDADECFLTGTAAEVVPVVRVDKRPIGTSRPGPMTKRFMRRFRERTATDGIMAYD
ncbi:branched-chain amino acid aminotransferase [candidate division BRC1 bacterium SM23_51]|nr:MAG: branched-chain amino acid aminotransferase [candidate division BRC1 bacterium SM23_51]